MSSTLIVVPVSWPTVCVSVNGSSENVCPLSSCTVTLTSFVMLPLASTSSHGFGSPSMTTRDSQKMWRRSADPRLQSPPLPKSRKPPEFGQLVS
jgi:hypothetical protein